MGNPGGHRFVEGGVHLPSATPEQRSRFRALCDAMEMPVSDCAPPPREAGRELVSFFVEREEMPEICQLARDCGLSKTALSRVVWRMGSYFLLWQNGRLK